MGVLALCSGSTTLTINFTSIGGPPSDACSMDENTIYLVDNGDESGEIWYNIPTDIADVQLPYLINYYSLVNAKRIYTNVNEYHNLFGSHCDFGSIFNTSLISSLPNSDFIFDVRCLPNPHWEPDLRWKPGLDEKVIEFLKKHKEVEEMFENIKVFLDRWIPDFIESNRSYINISIGCTGGYHRSVYLVEKLVEHFRNNSELEVSVRHRELGK